MTSLHSTDIELFSPSTQGSEAAIGPQQSSLPPVDRGRDAWTYLAAATVIETIVWGIPFSIGVVHSFWLSKMFPAGTPGQNLLSVAVTLQAGLMYCSGLWFSPILNRYPHHQKRIQIVALVIATIGMLASAFATKPWHIVVTLGLLYPFSGALYLPAATLLFQWWHARRGFASGIMFAGTGVGGSVFPFLIQGLLDHFGYKVTMLSIGLGYFILAAVSLVWIKPRLPLAPRGSAEAKRARRVDISFLSRSTFYAFAGAIMFTSLGNFIPPVWIPSFALDLDLSASDGTLLLSIMNAASVPGLLLLGYLTDRIPLRAVITLSCFGSAAACLLLWGFATSIPMLCVFCIAYGALGLSFSAVWTRLISLVAQDDPHLPNIIFPIFAFGRGIGNISSGPVASVLLKSDSLRGAKGGYGVRNYGPLLLYSGLTMLIGSFVGVAYRDPKPQGESRRDQ